MGNEHNAAREIFHRMFNVSIPEIYFHSQEEIDLFGMPTSGNKGVDETVLNSPRFTYLSIAGLTEFYDEGAPITFSKPSDTVMIYQLIQEHLSDWDWILKNFHNGSAPPKEDLYKLDEFARAILPMSLSFTDDNKAPSGGIGRMVQKMNNRDRGLKLPTFATQKGKTERVYFDENGVAATEREINAPKHQSFLPEIMKRHRGRS